MRWQPLKGLFSDEIVFLAFKKAILTRISAYRSKIDRKRDG
jgi:hypothetical protein